jgi:hypothetical protein
MISLWLVLIITAIVVTASKFIFASTITWKEYAVIMVVMFVITPILYLMAYNADLQDREVLSGKVTEKSHVAVPCQHSYKCNPYYVTVSHTSYTTVGNSRIPHHYTTIEKRWHTCYEHVRDYDWRVQTSFRSYDISRVDRQGIAEPPRWTEVVIGEPAYDYHEYKNYVKAAEFSLFKTDLSFKDSLYTVPPYPSIYDYYRMTKAYYVNGNHVGVNLPLSKGIGDINARIGSMKQVNITLIATDAGDKYPYALSKKWNGLKKNDFVILIGTKDFHKIDWVRAVSWSKKDLVHVIIRDDIMAIGTLDSTTKILTAIDKDVRENYIRREMKEFEYLKDQVKINPAWWWFIGIFVVVGGVTMIVCAIKYDWFNEENRNRY